MKISLTPSSFCLLPIEAKLGPLGGKEAAVGSGPEWRTEIHFELQKGEAKGEDELRWESPEEGEDLTIFDRLLLELWGQSGRDTRSEASRHG